MSSNNDPLTSKDDAVKKSYPVKGPGKSEATADTAVAAPPPPAGSAAATVYEDVRLRLDDMTRVPVHPGPPGPPGPPWKFRKRRT